MDGLNAKIGPSEAVETMIVEQVFIVNNAASDCRSIYCSWASKTELVVDVSAVGCSIASVYRDNGMRLAVECHIGKIWSERALLLAVRPVQL